MKIKVIGAGAAGNKAAINLLEKETLKQDEVLLVNSTEKDVPANYREMMIKISDNGGCGKERDLAKNLTLQSLSEGDLGNIDEFVDEDTSLVIVVSSTEGGTGCGSSVIITNYLESVVGVKTICFPFNGFEEDGRGLQNTIEYFQDMKDDFTVVSLSNKKFLQGAISNKLKAEKAANDEFNNFVNIIKADGIVDSEQNIDETDLFKTISTEGYMMIFESELKIKNVEQFNKIVTDIIDETRCIDTCKGMKRLAVFINATDETQENIDYTFDVIKEKLGYPYEVFTHVQNEEDQKEYIRIICSGMKLPTEELKEIYEKYKQQSNKVNKEKDSFFDELNELRGNSEDSMFNSANRKRKKSNKDTFFTNFTQQQEEKEESKSKEEFLNSHY